MQNFVHIKEHLSKCKECNNTVGPATRIVMPPPNIVTIHNKMMEAGLLTQAMMFIHMTAHKFVVNCLRCWLHRECGRIILNSGLPTDAAKISHINEATTFAQQGVSPIQFWTCIGNPNFN